jgi:quercetin dioxygenase-like cupin family protein
MQENQSQAAEARRLADMIGYQEGSVVSRVLLKKKTGNVTLFAFSAGQGLSEHTTPFEALLYGVEGEAFVEIGGETHRLREGETITLPADVPHAVQAGSDFKMMLIMIRS